MTKDKKQSASSDQKSQSVKKDSPVMESKSSSDSKTKSVAENKKDNVEAKKKSADFLKKSEETKPAEKSADSIKKSEETKPAEKSADSIKKSEEAKSAEKAPDQTAKDSQKSEEQSTDDPKQNKNSISLEGLFAFKLSMSTFYNEKGESLPVTALKYEPCRVSQIKSQKKENYTAVQVAFKAQKNKRCSKALIKHLKPAGFKEGARFVREVRQDLPEGIKVGQDVSIGSLKKGDLVKISSFSKGRGFSGVMKRWNFAGGRASHGSKSHRRTGSIGQHTEPARVMPGRKMPGQYGFKKVSRLKVSVVDVFPEEGIIFVKGPVPGARNTLVSLQKMPSVRS